MEGKGEIGMGKKRGCFGGEGRVEVVCCYDR